MSKANGVLSEFKAFIMRGSVLDLAVGIVIGSAFGAIVKSFVDDILMPPIGLLLGAVDFSNLFVVLREGAKQPGPYASVKAAADAGAVAWRYGLFLSSVVSFLIIALAVFFLIKAINRLMPKAPAQPAAPTTRPCPYCQMEISLKATRCPYCTSELTGH
jgi:large conductance mechanosensitive channel